MADEIIAMQLQEEYDREAAESLQDENGRGDSKILDRYNGTSIQGYSSHTFSNLSPVDPSLEFTDPNPEIRMLFLQFNEDYFWGKLSGIEVKWSPRMTLCAGLCVYEGHGGLCSVRLSLPLLKLRPRKDLVETLLHEMIHAYLFVTNNDRDHDGHGPNFQKHMQRLNKSTGANITIYHTFHDEVQSYQQHWWRCDGPCQHRKPFFGYVKRAMNRAPSSADFWWKDHQAKCGGAYHKIKEPEDYGKKKAGKKKEKDKNNGKDIQLFMNKGQINNSKNVSNKFKNTDREGNMNSSISNNGTSSPRSKSIVVGGVLIPKSSLKQSSLFTSIAGSSHSVLKTKNGEINSSPIKNAKKQKTIQEIFGGKKTSDIKPCNEKDDFYNRNGQNSKFVNSNGETNCNFPRNFQSVCVGGKGGLKIGHYKSNISKGKRKKYIFDELDDDNGLWDKDSLSPAKVCKANKMKQISDNDRPWSMSPLNKKLKDTCKIPKQENAPESPNVKRDIFGELGKKNDSIKPPSMEGKHNSCKKSSDYTFPGKGYLLGAVVKKETPSLNEECFKSEFKYSDPQFSSRRKTVPELKRSFDEVIDISDEESAESSWHSSKKLKIKEESTCASSQCNFIKSAVDDNEDNPDNQMPITDLYSGQSINTDEDAGNYVHCPVCNTKVFQNLINSHLDTCLEMA